MIKISWIGNCKCCQAPLDLLLYAIGEHDVKVLRTFMYMFPGFNLDDNDSMYKFIGLKANWVCISCFRNIRDAKRNAYGNFKRFGNPTHRRANYKSTSQDELKNWFDKLQEFAKRKDIKDLILPEFEDDPTYFLVCE